MSFIVQVISVINRWPGLQKISFVAHSLGGLVARYAVGRLFELSDEEANDSTEHHEHRYEAKIGGLEPINFITFATPHLGSIGHKQVQFPMSHILVCWFFVYYMIRRIPYPLSFRWKLCTLVCQSFFYIAIVSIPFQLPLLCGLPFLERSASQTAHWVAGRSGKHLFLTDENDGKPPLLLQMVKDSDDIKFMCVLNLQSSMAILECKQRKKFMWLRLWQENFVAYVGQHCVLSSVGLHMQMQTMIVSSISFICILRTRISLIARKTVYCLINNCYLYWSLKMLLAGEHHQYGVLMSFQRFLNCYLTLFLYALHTFSKILLISSLYFSP